ncbi:DUF5366 family protein [Bacillus chungangensis]|uniref:Membrane protein n=1 Tax=Bacillus chungangensis TaxID=587633 RepID=A0ABT9WYQ8_9BACI|nr:DUF5366 family protein [Bacillus chungangensis]MDQ0178436.1 putative membrane protein [Bacillus chungangensis]
MRNTYLTGYLPFISIVFFSLSLSVYTQGELLGLFKKIGLYHGMMEFLSEVELKMGILFVLVIFFFMIFSALKLIADTINELSLLFFSKDSDGDILKNVRSGSIIYFLGSCIALLSMKYFLGIIIILVATTVIYFIYYVYKIGPSLNIGGLFGIIFFEVFVWSILLLGTGYLFIKLYNSMVASLPI